MDNGVTFASLAGMARNLMGFLEENAVKRSRGGDYEELSRLHDHLLDDVGLTRHQVEELRRKRGSA
ncbi:hypothetical protein N825_13770 [Skermanella stibiiresistens SB22]|jgi:uncharacterized protein YjiS (DUF1127 family)|uniref:YjiS-like domain-containing protein n=1 Tax=Skermanella stibiiresistens SB22 TaxID=1385369 RepID=W9H0A2_9PROT|nr:DUF1127 domain-containing protein [Skermanella stibiiresistens]EWY38271.1 hypothetical protein N825_13770 [Skermanella stibiiresistens SB22]